MVLKLHQMEGLLLMTKVMRMRMVRVSVKLKPAEEFQQSQIQNQVSTILVLNSK